MIVSVLTDSLQAENISKFNFMLNESPTHYKLYNNIKSCIWMNLKRLYFYLYLSFEYRFLINTDFYFLVMWVSVANQN